jgi:septal ring factor EnvC (AmiA/AmiB activator)
MRRSLKCLVAAGGLALLSVAAICSADSSDTDEGRLRDVLRSTMLQLRDAQTDLANLQAGQAAQADEKKTLEDQLALLTKHGAEDRAAANKTADGLKATLAEQATEIARLRDVMAQWKAAAEKAAAAAAAAEARNDKQAADAVALERRVEDLEAKNAELARIGDEILTRYEKFALGEQFLAREPFIGRTRVAIENLVQDYDDKLLAQRADP